MLATASTYKNNALCMDMQRASPTLTKALLLLGYRYGGHTKPIGDGDIGLE